VHPTPRPSTSRGKRSHRKGRFIDESANPSRVLIRVCRHRLVASVDSLHTLAGAQTAEEYLRKASLAVTIVSGNHDARWSRAREHRFLQRGNFTLHHGDRVLLVPSGSCEIVGHLHPAVSWADGAGMRLKMPALVASDHRLVLPAFSPWAAGVPWKKPLPGETIYAISSKRIFTVPYAPAQKEPRAL